MNHSTIFGLIACAALAACGGQPMQYHAADEIRPGPGLLTGEKGEFVLGFDLPASPDTTAERQEFERAKQEGAAGSDEYREFQEWREWREWKRRQGK